MLSLYHTIEQFEDELRREEEQLLEEERLLVLEQVIQIEVWPRLLIVV
jgi:hypothetical protein